MKPPQILAKPPASSGGQMRYSYAHSGNSSARGLVRHCLHLEHEPDRCLAIIFAVRLSVTAEAFTLAYLAVEPRSHAAILAAATAVESSGAAVLALAADQHLVHRHELRGAKTVQVVD